MTWSLTAAGHPGGNPEVWAALEHELAERLGEVLGDARYGVSASQFTGTYEAGTPGLPEPEPEPALPTLPPEAQVTALRELNDDLQAQVDKLQAALAATEGSDE
jgi:hypothetical protein